MSDILDETLDVIVAGIGHKIMHVQLVDDDGLHFRMENGYCFKVWDDGQSCCEQRYMTTDDVLGEYCGAYLLGIETKEAPDVEDEHGEVHEVVFLEVETSKGSFTVSTHNEHSGYYGGFNLRADQTEIKLRKIQK